MNYQSSVVELPVREELASRARTAVYRKTSRQRSIDRQLSKIILFDLLLLNFCLTGLLFLQRDFPPSPIPWGGLLLFLFLANVSWLLISPFTDIYRIFERIRLSLKVRDLFWNSLIFFGILGLVYYPFFFATFQVHFLIPAFFSFITLSSGLRYVIRHSNKTGAAELTYVVVGGEMADLHYLESVFEKVYGKNTYFLGRFAQDELPGVRNLGKFQDLERYLKENSNITKLLYFYSELSKEEVQRIVQLCRNRFIDFEVVPIGLDFFEQGVQVEQLAHLPIFRRKKEPLWQLRNKILKRAFDIVFSMAVILLIFPWLLPVIALLIWLESRGPVFFIQKRTGYWHRPFNCIKFRTMRVNDLSDRKQATKGDDRITRLGAFLRKTNLDELPQFFNVLLGDMSVVGPRPHMLKHTEDYSRLIDRFMIRHEVKPGITGWAQVNGWRGPTEEIFQMAKRVEYDVYYIENWSFWLDCRCIFLTVFNIFKGEENAF